MATVEELRSWCEQSRLLLKTQRKIVGGDTKRTKELEAHLDKIAELLPPIQFWKAKVFRELFLAFESLQQRMRALVANTKKLSRDDKTAAQKELNVEAGKLEERLKQSTKDMVEDRRRMAELQQAGDDYRADHQHAVEQIELLKVIPKANPVNVGNELDQIHAKTTPPSVQAFGTGREAIKKLLPKITKIREDAEKLRKDELAQWEKRPIAEKKLEEAQARLGEIENLVGIEAQLGEYRKVMQEARGLAAKGSWIQVMSALEKLDKLPQGPALKKESEKQLRSLAELPRYTEGQGYVNKLKELVTPEEGLQYQKGYQSVSTMVLSSTGVKNETIKALSDAVDNLKSELALKTNLKKALDEQGHKLTNLMGELRELMAPLELLKEQASFENFAALASSKRLEPAWTLGETLEDEFEALLPGRRKARDDWAKRRTVAANIDKQLGQLLESECPAVSGRVTLVRGLVSPALTKPLEDQHDYVRLVDNLARARTEWLELKRQDEAYKGLAAKRAEGDKAIDEAVKKITPLLGELDKASNKAQSDKGESLFDTTKHLRADMADIRKAWERACGTAIDDKTLGAALADALRGLKAVEEDTNAAKSPQGLERLALGRQREIAGEEFNRLWPQFEDYQRQIQALNNELADTLARKGAELQTQGPLDWIKGLEGLKQLVEEAKGTVTQAGNAALAIKNTIAKLGEEVRAEIERVRKASKNSKTFADAFTALEDERKQLLLQGRSTNTDALQDAEQGLRALKARATKFAPPEGDTSGQSIDKVMQALERAEALLEKATKHLEDNYPKGLVQLTQRLALLKTAVVAAEPAQGMEKVAAFTLALTSAEGAADKVVQVREEFDKLEPPVTQSFEVFKERKATPEYAKQLEGRLKEARKLRKDPTQLYQGLTNLKAIDTELKAATADLNVAMAKEKGVRESKHQDEVDLKLYERTVKVCEDRWMPEAARAVKDSQGDKALLLELERMLETARTTKKQGDVARALHQAEMTVERCKQITADPYGPAIGSRNNLPKDNQVWREALAAFVSSLDVVRDKTLELAPTAHANVRSRLQSMLDQLKTRFDPNLFEGSLRALGDPRADDAARRAAREAALTKVRSVQATLQALPQIKLLLKNPAAAKEFSLGYRRLQSALARLDANVSRCVH